MVGLLPYKSEQQSAQVLYRYPPASASPEIPKVDNNEDESTKFVPISGANAAIPFGQVIRFCFPKGIDYKSLCIAKPKSELHNILFGEVDMEKAENSFVFIGSNEDTLFYGLAVINEELLERPPSFMAHGLPPGSWSSALINDTILTTNRVYVLISRFPFFKVHFSVLYSIISRERLYALEESTANSSDITPGNKELKVVSINEIVTIIQTYYSLPPPAISQSLQFKIPTSSINIEIEYPKGDHDRLLCDWTIPVIFRCLKLESIMLLISSIMLEKHIVIECSNIGILSCLVLSIIVLFRPYVWQGPFISGLPVEIQEYLLAPVPFIVGVLSLPKLIERQLEAVIIKIDATTEQIILPKDLALLPMPKLKQLENNLRPYHTFLSNCTNDRFASPYRTTEKQVEAAHKIMEELKNYQQDIINVLLPFISSTSDTDQIISKVQEEPSLKKKEKEFLVQFINTQSFSMYLDDMIANISEEAEHNREVATHLDEKIRQLELNRTQAIAKAKYYEQEAAELGERIESLREARQSLHVGSKTRTFNLNSSVELLKQSFKEKINNK